MKWSFSIGRVAGTDVRIHVTFFLLLFFVGLGSGLAGTAFVLALFGCVLLHEFGHVFAARRYGIRTPDITLLPIGGLARLERMPRTPRHELVVALAGPAVNVAIAAVLFLLLLPGGGPATPPGLAFPLGDGRTLLTSLMWANLWLVIFNLVPAFPMDGGRVLRALLASRFDYARATQIAATVGQGLAFAGGLAGFLTGNLMLIVVAFFIFLGAGQEAATARFEDATHGLPVTAAMITRFDVLSPQDSLQRAVDLLLAGSQHDFPVIDGGGRVRAILLRGDLIPALASHGPSHPAFDIARRDPPAIPNDFSLTHALETLSGSGFSTLPVVDAVTDRLVGILTSENIAEMVMVTQAIHARRQRAGASSV
jgi:Zn-dependent protease/CBS domain-containing protein